MRIFLALAEAGTRAGVDRQPAFGRTGVTEWALAEIRPDRFVVVAQGINAAPSGTIDLGDTTTVLPTNREVQVANFLGVTRAEVAGKTIGELILLLDGGTWVPHRDGKVRISLAGVVLLERDAIQGGAVEITDPFTYSNGRLSTVSSAVWDDESANMNVSSNQIVWPDSEASGIAIHNTELSSADHYVELDVRLENTGEYSAGGGFVRSDGSVGGTADGYRFEVGHWDIGGINYNWGVSRYDNGSTTEVATGNISAATTTVHRIRVEAEGTTLTLFVDDVEEGSYGSASSYTTNKFAGFFASSFAGGLSVEIDNFEAGSLAGAPPPSPVFLGLTRSTMRLR